ncbi:MAG TPA: GNAT family N-acetyltransferase [Ignavibacteria bacterium]|nr:GNAT family N-acetyltransferase [Ignavibacteria bacterium]
MSFLKRTDSDDPDFQDLVKLLDAELKILDGDEHTFYSQFNKIDKIRNAVVFYIDDKPSGCGAFKEYDTKTAEIKRMFVIPEERGKGAAKLILKELEIWVAELKFTECILETGLKQSEAIKLYQKAGYEIIPNYGQYKNVSNSVCMKKSIG